MKQFAGFPVKTKFTPLPNIFFSSLLPQITDITELKVTLHIFASLYPKRGYPKFVTYQEMLNDVSLLKSLANNDKKPEAALPEALEKAVRRGTILHIRLGGLDKDGVTEDVYLLNTEPNQQVIARLKNGELVLTGLKTREPPVAPPVEPPDIFTLYEENIGMLTPLIADELREAEKLYPVDWIREAIKEAVLANKRKWAYIERILERWTTEGKSDGTHRRYLKENTDPDKYIKGKYGHMVQR